MQSESKPFRRGAFDSIVLLAILTGLYPGLFLVSKNWFVLGTAQSVYLIIALIAPALIALSLLYFLFLHTSLARRVSRTAVVVLAVYFLVGYFNFIVVDLNSGNESVDVRGIILLAIAAAGAFLLIASWRKPAGLDFIRPLNVGLSVMSSLAFLSLVLSIASAWKKMPSEASTVDTRTKIYDQVRFQSTPNIYLLVPDSYPSNRSLERFFHFNNSSFSGQLRDLGFRLYDDYFSSYPHTLESVHSMLSMSHNYFEKSIGKDAIGLREVIAGRNNDLFRILESNGYKSLFIHETDYIFKGHCDIERCVPSLSAYD